MKRTAVVFVQRKTDEINAMKDRQADILTICIEFNSNRFIVNDDGSIFICVFHGNNNRSSCKFFANADSSAYLAATADMKFSDKKMINELVPPSMRNNRRLGVQRENGYTVWTLYDQNPPNQNYFT